MTLPRGRARRGQTPHEKNPVQAGARLNTIALLSKTGVQSEYYYSGSFNAKRFIYYLEYVALPLRPGQVLIMDRHPAHCAQEVRDFLRENHVDYLYLPPYSPELNPIEEVFSKVKHYIKKNKPRTPTDLFKAIKKGFQGITPKDITGYFNHSDYFLINSD